MLINFNFSSPFAFSYLSNKFLIHTGAIFLDNIFIVINSVIKYTLPKTKFFNLVSLSSGSFTLIYSSNYSLFLIWKISLHLSNNFALITEVCFLGFSPFFDSFGGFFCGKSLSKSLHNLAYNLT